MIFPLYAFSGDLAMQRRIDALTLLELSCLDTREVNKIEVGLLKFDIMWWVNRFGYAALAFICFKGRLLERCEVTNISITRSFIALFAGIQYLYLGDSLAGSLLWEEYKYIYFKYEPSVRELKIKRNNYFVCEENYLKSRKNLST